MPSPARIWRMENSKRPSEDLWRRTLSQIPSTYGRMNYLAERRNPNTGRYEHAGLTMMFGEEDSNAALRDSHIEAFRAWLELNLEQQQADLLLYWSELPTDRKTLVENWIRLRPHANVLPATASEADRKLYLNDLDVLLAILKRESAASGRSPAESPRQ